MHIAVGIIANGIIYSIIINIGISAIIANIPLILLMIANNGHPRHTRN